MNMNIKLSKFTHIVLLFALVLLVLPGIASAAVVDVYLSVQATTVTMPDSTVVPVWGFAQCTDGTFATCNPATIPGPRITAVEGDDLTIHLQNTLLNFPVSVVIPGQTTTMTPVWVDIADPYGAATGTGSRPALDTTSRVRSFTYETAPATTNTYTWASVKPGTYIYESGTHPALQVQMGLYGALTVDTAGGEAYAGVPYNAEVVMFYSELDPVFHNSVVDTAPPAYNPTNVYKPRYFLVNGMPYAAGDPTIPAGNVGQNVLIRFLNAGIDTHMPMLKGSDVTIVAQDGYPAPYVRDSYSIQLPAGKTVDAIFVPTQYGTYPLLDRRLFLVNDMQTPGGLQAQLQVGTAGSPAYIAVYSNVTWYIDSNQSGTWDGVPPDDSLYYGLVGATPVAGDWNGDGNPNVGVFSSGTWYLDINGNGSWDGSVTDIQYSFNPAPGAQAVAGDWNGDGRTEIGMYDSTTGTWYLDLNSNGIWDGGAGDATYIYGSASDIAVPGDWNGDGITDLGVYNPATFTWDLDMNGNRTQDGIIGGDASYYYGFSGVTPVSGDWDGSGTSKVGVFASGRWYVDFNGSGTWEGMVVDRYYYFGFTGSIPVTAN